jgi:hypothetical protein
VWVEHMSINLTRIPHVQQASLCLMTMAVTIMQPKLLCVPLCTYQAHLGGSCPNPETPRGIGGGGSAASKAELGRLVDLTAPAASSCWRCNIITLSGHSACIKQCKSCGVVICFGRLLEQLAGPSSSRFTCRQPCRSIPILSVTLELIQTTCKVLGAQALQLPLQKVGETRRICQSPIFLLAARELTVRNILQHPGAS